MATRKLSIDPVLLKQLEEIRPEFADLYANRVRRNDEHEQRLQRHEVWLTWAGLLSGLFVAIAFLFASFQLITDGHDVTGGVIATVDLVGLVALFITRRAQK